MTTSTPVTFATKGINIVNHFKAYTADTKGLKDLEQMIANGSLTADDVTAGKNDKEQDTVKRNSVTHAVAVVDLAVILDGTGLSLNQIDHLQELVNGAVKKEVQKLVSDVERKAPVTDADLPTWEAVLEAPFAKRAVAVKITMDMVKATTKLLVDFLKANDVKQGGIELAESLCIKKFSLTALNSVQLPILEKVQGLLNGWYEQLPQHEQLANLDVFDLWDKAIEAKLNPQMEDKAVDDIF